MSAQKAIIFGINGQDGFYLSELLQKQSIEVIGVSRSKGKWIQGDISDRGFVSELIRQTKPAFIFHLAAQSTTRYEHWLENHRAISDGTLFILDAVKEFSPKTKVFISGSGLQFINKGQPIHETDPFEARDPYSVSRIHTVYAARYYRRLGLKVYIGYFFNHDSPLRSERHMSQKIATAAKHIARGGEDRLPIGDLTTRKEWGFAGDIVNAIWVLVQQDRIFEAVIGTGKSYSIRDWLDACFALIDKDWNQYVIPVEGFNAEYDQLVSQPDTIFSLGWKPAVSFNQLAKMMVF